jgi:hypothetical protein
MFRSVQHSRPLAQCARRRRRDLRATYRHKGSVQYPQVRGPSIPLKDHSLRDRRQLHGLVPPKVVAEHAFADETQLNLTRALDNRQLTCVTVVHLGRMILHIARRAQQLNRQA